MKNWLLIACAALALGCVAPDDNAFDADEQPLTATRSATIDGLGHSEEIRFTIPPGTRNLTIMADGAKDKLFGLSSLRIGGRELVGIDLGTSPGAAMRRSYFTEESGRMPGSRLTQSVRLGTFTQIVPDAPGVALAAGEASIRVASDAPGAQVRVTIATKSTEDTRLHLNLVYASAAGRPAGAHEDAFRAELTRIFAQAGIVPVFDEVLAPASVPTQMTHGSEPQEPPTSEAVVIAKAAKAAAHSGALPLIVVDVLPRGVAGLSLGVPGPVDPASDYFGVLVKRSSSPTSQARVAAHELSHFLGLQHVTNRTTTGEIIPDPIPDTEPGRRNLMESGGGGSVITPGQAFVLKGSALLSAR
jgi:hypothetical protein